MALFEIIIELPVGLDVDTLTVAAKQAGYDDAKTSRTDAESLFSVLIRHPKSSFETGHMLAETILQHLPPQSRYHSHRSSVSISEMSPEDLDALLNEIENSTYGQAS
ncbi:hypothetical protein [Rhizobium sp. MHM7A]|uniref:hypothetical protein n=1 Tax=Rhizobium sp. MHM7A TaxID=2583233 RepID=UPI00110586C0|nr:hypothetical protein [Rhizobium sp. MHM7A]TLX17063.1 hypothetical protein FFR93_07050 [Rhizobium sp. MHM7A]